jgi:Holliday junction resolvase RusA-like endonuclease
VSLLTAAEIEAGLVRTGVPREVAHRRALELAGHPHEFSPADVVADASAIRWPLRLMLPWSYLVSDNVRKKAVVKMVNGTPVAEMMLTSEYRRAMGLTRERAKSHLVISAPVAIPLALTAMVWVPDEMRAHDVPNFSKCALDALEGVIYTKDRWVWDNRWIRAGVDVDAPRAELTILPLLAAA